MAEETKMRCKDMRRYFKGREESNERSERESRVTVSCLNFFLASDFKQRQLRSA